MQGCEFRLLLFPACDPPQVAQSLCASVFSSAKSGPRSATSTRHSPEHWDRLPGPRGAPVTPAPLPWSGAHARGPEPFAAIAPGVPRAHGRVPERSMPSGGAGRRAAPGSRGSVGRRPPGSRAARDSFSRSPPPSLSGPRIWPRAAQQRRPRAAAAPPPLRPHPRPPLAPPRGRRPSRDAPPANGGPSRGRRPPLLSERASPGREEKRG